MSGDMEISEASLIIFTMNSSKLFPLISVSTWSHPKKHLSITPLNTRIAKLRTLYLNSPGFYWDQLFLSNWSKHLLHIYTIFGMFYFKSQKLKALEIIFLLFFQITPSLKAIPFPKTSLIPLIKIYSLGYLAFVSPERNYFIRFGFTIVIITFPKALAILTSYLEYLFF